MFVTCVGVRAILSARRRAATEAHQSFHPAGAPASGRRARGVDASTTFLAIVFHPVLRTSIAKSRRAPAAVEHAGKDSPKKAATHPNPREANSAPCARR